MSKPTVCGLVACIVMLVGGVQSYCALVDAWSCAAELRLAEPSPVWLQRYAENARRSPDTTQSPGAAANQPNQADAAT